uniref:Uncharacterized protein n=1 Tax=Glycine max TaxID=3847 RepID=C6TLT5_SOYBN|nr:unknown [Glycine max]
MDSEDVNGCLMDKHKPVVASSLVCEKVEDHVNGEDDSDSNSLLPPRRGGMSRNCEKTRRKVQWNDRNENKLAEVLEYEPRGHCCDLPTLIMTKTRQLGKFDLCCVFEVGRTVQ